jgi:nucleoside-diphosphate-sugar epimerase
MKMLVTGASGFLGAAVLKRARELADVVALRRDDAPPPMLDGVEWITQDLAAPLSRGLPQKIDVVLHLAQSRRYREFPAGAADVFEINAAATVRLLDYCRSAGGRTFVYASSGAVYGPAPTPLREDSALAPPGFYGVSKLAGELAVESFRGELRAHALRFFFIYGPGQRQKFIPELIERVRDQHDIALAGDDGIRVNPVYIDDAAAAVIAMLDHPSGLTLNVAGPQIVSIRQIAEQIGRRVDREPQFTIGPPQADITADLQRQRDAVGPPQTTFDEGLTRTLASQ